MTRCAHAQLLFREAPPLRGHYCLRRLRLSTVENTVYNIQFSHCVWRLVNIKLRYFLNFFTLQSPLDSQLKIPSWKIPSVVSVPVPPLSVETCSLAPIVTHVVPSPRYNTRPTSNMKQEQELYLTSTKNTFSYCTDLVFVFKRIKHIIVCCNMKLTTTIIVAA